MDLISDHPFWPLQSGLIQSYPSLKTETKDGLAYIGSVPELPRCFFTLGFGGNEITYSVTAAEIVRDSIQGKIHPDARLFRFGS